MPTILERTVLEDKIFDPNFLNLEFIFYQLYTLAQKIWHFIISLGAGVSSGVDVSLLKTVAWLLSLALIGGIVYSVRDIWKIRKKQERELGGMQISAIEKAASAQKNERWEKVTDLMMSSGESDWRLAIMEADNMLADVLEKMGYVGETIGEKLKGIEAGDFKTLSQAWEAHKVRNQIAHEGVNFHIDKRGAERVIGLFREVFEEFHYI